MRSLVVLALAALPCTGLAAQADLVHQDQTNHRAAFSRRCLSPKIEMVDAQPSAADAAVPKGFLSHVSDAVFFYFSPVEWRTPRFALAHITVHRDGRVTDAQLVTPSGMPAFDSAVVEALSSVAAAHAVGALPSDVDGDTLGLALYVGRHAGSDAPYLEKRTTCPAWPSAHNPEPEYPTEMKQQNVRGFVQTEFMVGVDGRPDTSTFRILQSSGPAFSASVRDVIQSLHFQPATVQGKKVAQLTQQTFTFGFVDNPAH